MNDPGPAAAAAAARDLSAVDPHRLSRLWSAAMPAVGNRAGGRPPKVGGAAARARPSPADLAETLRRQLASPLPPPPDPGPDEAARLTLAELLAHPSPPADALRRLKDWAKAIMSDDGDDEVPREVAGALYFAAVSAGRVRGVADISDLPDARVRKGAAWALRQPWLDASLAGLFREAVAATGSSATGATADPPPPPG